MPEHDFSPEQNKDRLLSPPEPENASLEDALAEAGTLIFDRVKQGRDLYEESIAKIEKYEQEKDIETADLKTKAKEEVAKHFFEQHLNLVHLYGFWESSSDRAYEKLSPASKELYRTFVGSLPADSLDSTEEAIANILRALDGFEKKPASENEKAFPKDLAAFLKKYYAPFREVKQLIWEERKKNLRRSLPPSVRHNSPLRSWWKKITGTPTLHN